MHGFFHLLHIVLKLLMKVVMLITKEKTNYLKAPREIISYTACNRICSLCHITPSLILSIFIGVKVVPEMWPYYAIELEKNGFIVTVIVVVLFILIAIVNGIIMEKILEKVNAKYRAYKISINVLE